MELQPLNFCKTNTKQSWRKVCSTNGSGQKWMATCRRMKVDPYLSPCTKCSSKWIKDIDVKLETQKQLEGKVGVYFKMETLAVVTLVGFSCSGNETNN